MPSKSKEGAQKLLAKYRAKRNFEVTAEPSGSESAAASSANLSFCIQKHAATRLHYDFRLELDGVLKSWAVAKGPSLVPSEKRLAVEVEDHPLAYGGFEGIIPAGQYGGGTVMLWDRGTWTPLEEPHAALKKGAMKFELHGEKLSGRWALVRMPPRPKDRSPNWLLIKEKDAVARLKGPSLPENDDVSVLSGRTMDQIAGDGDRVWQSAKSELRNTPPQKPEPKRKKTIEVPAFIEPELAMPAEAPPSGREWLHEMKFDGYRLLACIANGKLTLFTRRGLDWTGRFPEIRDALGGLAQDALIDGEAVVLNGDNTSDFSALQARLAGANQADLIYIAFDLLSFDGEDLRTQPLLARKQRLRSILEPLKKRGHLVYSDHVEGSGPAFFAEACKAGLEGIICKRADSQYRSGRVGDWLKVKCGRRQEFVIGGFVPPSTGHKGIGSLSVGYYQDGKLTYAGRVGTGFSGAISRQLRERLEELVRKTSPFAGRLPREATKDAIWVKPELVAEVAYTAFTADGNIRHGSFKGLREDKPPEEVVLEQPVAPAPKGSSGKQRSEAEVQGVRITHPDRVVDEETGLTKIALAEYYADIARWILPHLKDRPLSFVRCPEGVGAQCFYQRHIAAGMPSDVHPIHLTEKGKKENYLSIDTLKGLLALVQFGAMELHPWGAPTADTDHPDRLIFDLDPDAAVPWARVVETAFKVRDRLKKRKLTSFVKTTGGKGLHVVAPLDGSQTWEIVKRFAHDFAQAFADENPDQFIAVMSKKDRKGKIFIDYLRNERSATAVSPYSTRARAGAPVATPLSWSELSPSIDPHAFTVQAVSRRLKALKKDPWDLFFKLKQKPT